MTNKRDLKKMINYIYQELMAECMATSLYKRIDAETVNATLSSIMLTRQDFISRVSHPEPGIKPTVYYKKLQQDYNKAVSEIIDIIAGL